jgi:hypothetical protein
MKLVKTGYLYPSNSRVSETDSISRTFTEIDYPITMIGTTIIDPNNGTPFETNFKFSSKRECLVRCSKAVLIVSLTIGGEVSVEARTVPTGDHRQSS